MLFAKTHEWLDQQGSHGKVGLTDYATEQLGDIVYVALPSVGDRVTAGASFCEVESVKAVSEVYSPVSGTVVAVNEALLDAPETLNADPFGAWIVEVAIDEVQEGLLDQTAYDAIKD